jgi:hypothetical protein
MTRINRTYAYESAHYMQCVTITNQLALYWGIIAVCFEIYSFVKGFPLYTVFPHVPVAQYSLRSHVVSHTPTSPSLSLGLPFVLVISGSHSRILRDSLFSGILFKYPNCRSSFPTITVIQWRTEEGF